jgi:hypothetical protein
VSRLDDIRAAALAELRAQPVAPSWHRELVRLLAATLATTGLVAVISFFTGVTTWEAMSGHAPTVALLLGVQVLAAWAAVAPRAGNLRLGAALAGVLGMAAIVAARVHVHGVASQPQWVCTVSHLGVAVPPIIATLLVLRFSAHEALRAVVAGISVGTTGAITGELGCGQGWVHVLVFHLLAWVLVIVAAAFISPRLSRRTFAP